MRAAMRGFTLIELVMVILLLGIMATFTSQFIGIGTQIYGDASSREQLMSDARFAMERLNRELRDAVPGSERIEASDGSQVESGPCLRFWPIATSGRYLGLNVPIVGLPGSLQLIMVAPASGARAAQLDDYLVVFPVPRSGASNTLQDANGCDYGRCVARVTGVGLPLQALQSVQYASNETLAGQSPGMRVYFANQQVRYCVEGRQLTRASGPIENVPPILGVPMAESLGSGNFYREQTAFNAQGEFGMRLVFERKGESVTFNHKIGVLNVP